mgnify:CR=1 FL=1
MNRMTGILLVIGVAMGAIVGGLVGMFIAPAQAIIFYPHGVSVTGAFWGTAGLGMVCGGVYVVWYTRKRRLPL